MWDLLFDGVLTIALYPTFCIWLICFYSFKMWKMTSLYLCVIHFHYCSALKRLLVYFHDYMWLIVCESKINCPTVCCRCFAESWNGAAAEPLCFCLDPELNKQSTSPPAGCAVSLLRICVCPRMTSVCLRRIHALCTVAFSGIFENVTQRWCGTSKAPSLHHRLSSSTLLAEWLKSPAMITF